MGGNDTKKILQLFLLCLLAIFLIEAIIMFGMPVLLPNMDQSAVALTDALILTLVLLPLLYLLIYRPMKKHMTEEPVNTLFDVVKEEHGICFEVFQSAADAIYIIDAVSGRIVDANPAAIKRAGISREKLLARSFEELGRPEDSAAVRDYLYAACQGEPVLLSMVHRLRDSSLLPVEASLFLVKKDKDSNALLASVVRDISYRAARLSAD